MLKEANDLTNQMNGFSSQSVDDGLTIGQTIAIASATAVVVSTIVTTTVMVGTRIATKVAAWFETRKMRKQAERDQEDYDE